MRPVHPIVTVKELRNDEVRDIVAILNQPPTEPYAIPGRRIEQEAYELFFKKRLETRIERGSSLVARVGEEPAAIACVSLLPWDTQRLHVTCGNLDIAVSAHDPSALDRALVLLVDDTIKLSRECGLERVSTRVDCSQVAIIHALERNGFLMMDSLLTFQRETEPRPGSIDPAIRRANANDGEQVADIARHAFREDRFHADDQISPQIADELYASWARGNSDDSSKASTLVATDEVGVAGFISLRVDEEVERHLGLRVGVIDLIATAQRSRRTGVASRLVEQALRGFDHKPIDLVQVGTQASNLAACRLYQRLGFEIVSSSFSLTRWIDRG